MHTQPCLESSTDPSAAAAAPASSRRVVDAPTRMFHWLFALCFVGAYLSADADHWLLLHETLGYTMAGLLGFRLLYGVLGPRHARLGLMWRKLRSAPAWFRSLTRAPSLAHLNDRQGQSLLMALAVVTLLLLVLPLTFTGYATVHDWGGWLEDLHEFFGETMLIVVLAHLVLILGLSLLRRKNQAMAMLTGQVDGTGPDLVKNNHRWLAALVLIAVLAYWSWEWQQSLQAPTPTPAWSGAAHQGDHRSRHDDDD